LEVLIHKNGKDFVINYIFYKGGIKGKPNPYDLDWNDWEVTEDEDRIAKILLLIHDKTHSKT
jgi:hypothetical protein